MCLLVFATRLHPDLPLVVGANRDELIDRPAVPMDVLRAEDPLVVGGRDLLAGGTWMAVNEHGVVAGLTNRPLVDEGRDPTRRSRGELPLLLASSISAAAGVEALRSTVRPGDYNPAWLAVADREALFTVDLTGEEATVTEHPPGLHVFENRPPGTPSLKVDRVRALLGPVEGLPGDEVAARIAAALADHEIPDEGEVRLPAARAACVHSDVFATRWSGVVVVGQVGVRPTIRYAAGTPCDTPVETASWTAVVG
jgi:uncharacterized protein with NRDE domain